MSNGHSLGNSLIWFVNNSTDGPWTNINKGTEVTKLEAQSSKLVGIANCMCCWYSNQYGWRLRTNQRIKLPVYFETLTSNVKILFYILTLSFVTLIHIDSVRLPNGRKYVPAVLPKDYYKNVNKLNLCWRISVIRFSIFIFRKFHKLTSDVVRILFVSVEK